MLALNARNNGSAIDPASAPHSPSFSPHYLPPHAGSAKSTPSSTLFQQAAYPQEVYLLFNQFPISTLKVLPAATATPLAITGQERRALVSSRNCDAEPFYIQIVMNVKMSVTSKVTY
jgi:hypothetical protein